MGVSHRYLRASGGMLPQDFFSNLGALGVNLVHFVTEKYSLLIATIYETLYKLAIYNCSF